MGIHDGHRDRMRARFLVHGLDTFEEHEVLELLLFYSIARCNTNPLAHTLIRKFGSLAGVMDASFHDLMRVEGIGKHSAVLLKLIKPLCRRYLISQSQELDQLGSLQLCAQYLIPQFFGLKEEHVFLLCLDAKCKPICCREISIGTPVFAEIPMRRAAQLALDCNAVSVVLAHNHPNGDALPSSDDYTATTTLKGMLQPMGIILADHIVISGNNYVSMAQNGFLSMS